MLLHKINSFNLYKDSTVLMLGIISANFFNMLYQVVMGRLFTIDEFGLLSSFLGVFNMLLLPLSVVALAITHTVSRLDLDGRRGDIRTFLLSWCIRLGLFGLVVNIIIFLFPDQIAKFFQINRIAPLYVFGFVLIGTLIRTLFFAALRGIELFKVWSWGNLIQSIIRFLGGYILVLCISAYAGWGLLGHGLGIFAGLIFSMINLNKYLKDEVVSGKAIPDIGSYIGQSFSVLLGLAIFLVGDVVLIRRNFPEYSGLYAYASVLGHLILIAPQSICGALFPKVVKATSSECLNLYRTSSKMIMGITIILSVILFIFGKYLLWILFGDQSVNNDSIRWLRYIVLSLIPICYLQYTIQFLLAVKRFRGLWIVLLSAIFLITFLEFGYINSPDKLIFWMAGFSLVLSFIFDIRIRYWLSKQFINS